MDNENNHPFHIDYSNASFVHYSGNDFFRTSDFYHTAKPDQPTNYDINQEKGETTNIKKEVPIINAKFVKVEVMQNNPNEAFNDKNTRIGDLVVELAKLSYQFDKKEMMEYTTIRAWKENKDKRYNEVDRLFDDIRPNVHLSKTLQRINTQTSGYQQKWEDDEVVEVFRKLIKSKEYKDIKEGKGYDPNKKTSNRYKIH